MLSTSASTLRTSLLAAFILGPSAFALLNANEAVAAPPSPSLPAPQLDPTPQVQGPVPGAPTIQAPALSTGPSQVARAALWANQLEQLIQVGEVDRRVHFAADPNALGGEGRCTVWIEGAKMGTQFGEVSIRTSSSETLAARGRNAVVVTGSRNSGFQVGFKAAGADTWVGVAPDEVEIDGLGLAQVPRVIAKYEKLKKNCAAVVAEKKNNRPETPYSRAVRQFKRLMHQRAGWTFPKSGQLDCWFRADASSHGWNNQQPFAMNLRLSSTTVTADGESAIKVTCGLGMACISPLGDGTGSMVDQRSIPVAQGKAEQVVSSIQAIRMSVDACF